jgi:cell division protein FtsN
MGKESGSSRTDTIVKVMLIFFISLLSFSVGTFVGKQVSDSDHRRLALENEGKEGREVASDANTEGGAAKVSEKDVENLAEEFVNKEKGAEHTAAAEGEKGSAGEAKEGADGYKNYGHTEKSEVKLETKPENKAEAKTETKSESMTKASAKMDAKPAEHKMTAADATHTAAEKVAQNMAVTDGKPEERKPTSVLPSVAGSAIGKFTVQVASYGTEVEAKSHAGELKTKGWNAFYIPATIDGKTWYRVSVGLFNNANSAKSFRNDFVKESNSKTAIVQKIVE